MHIMSILCSTAAGIGLHVNTHKTEYMCFNQTADISTLDGSTLKLVDKFTYLGSSVSSTEKDIDTRLTKAWTAIDHMEVKPERQNETQLLPKSACVDTAIWMHYLDANKTAGEEARRQLHKNAACILKKSWRQHPTRHKLYGHLPPMTKTIQFRRTRLAGHCWRSRDELIIDVLLWTPKYGRAKAGRPARTYIQQLCEDMWCSPEDLPEAMNDREKWRERVRDIRAGGTTWWWWSTGLNSEFSFSLTSCLT